MTTKFRRRSVVLVAVPYTDAPDESKIRPAMIISPDAYHQKMGYVIVLPITSNMGARQEGDIAVVGIHIDECGLRHPSVIKVGYPVTVDASRIRKVLGIMPQSLYDAAWSAFLKIMGIIE